MRYGMSRFVPDDWILTDKLRQYARDKALTDKTIDDQEEAFRLHQFKVPVLDFDRAWMRWIRSAIEWGKVEPVVEREYTNTIAKDVDPEVEERKFQENIARFKR